MKIHLTFQKIKLRILKKHEPQEANREHICDELILQITEPENSEKELKNENCDLPLILIVDDNDDFRMILSDGLSEIYKIAEAENGQKGLILAQQLLPDLIISDLMMPVMDGMEMCKALKAEISTSQIPVLMLTATESEETRLSSLQIGIRDYITKPYNMKTLLSKIQKILNKQQESRQNLQVELEIKKTLSTPC